MTFIVFRSCQLWFEPSPVIYIQFICHVEKCFLILTSPRLCGLRMREKRPLTVVQFAWKFTCLLLVILALVNSYLLLVYYGLCFTRFFFWPHVRVLNILIIWDFFNDLFFVVFRVITCVSFFFLYSLPKNINLPTYAVSPILEYERRREKIFHRRYIRYVAYVLNENEKSYHEKKKIPISVSKKIHRMLVRVLERDDLNFYFILFSFFSRCFLKATRTL